jgi:hypothetical protein
MTINIAPYLAEIQKLMGIVLKRAESAGLLMEFFVWINWIFFWMAQPILRGRFTMRY